MSLPYKVLLWVDASYTESSTTAEESDRQVSGCKVQKRENVFLGGQPAVSLHFSCSATVDESAYAEWLVVTVCSVGDRGPAAYEVAIRGNTLEAIQRKETLFRAVTNGFRFTEPISL